MVKCIKFAHPKEKTSQTHLFASRLTTLKIKLMHKLTRGRKVPFAFPFTDHSIESLFMALLAELQQLNPLLCQQEVNEIIACCEVVVFKKNDLSPASSRYNSP